VHADVPQDSLQGMSDVLKVIAGRLAKAPASGAVQTASIPGAGDIKITADLNVAGLVSQVPHLLHLEPGTSLASGRLSHETTITLANGQATIATQTQLKDFRGTNSGTPVQLNDIETTAGLTAVGGDHPDLRDVKLSFTSAFASIQGGGQTLGKLNFQGSSDLKSVQQQISQVIDLDSLLQAPAGSHVSMGGTVAFDAHTDGDLTADESNVGFGADFSATGLHIDVPGRRTIDDPKLTASIGGNLHHTASQFVQAVNGLTVAVQSPAINFAAGADVSLGGRFGASIPSFAISQGSVDLHLLQEEFGGALSLFVPKPAEGQQPTLVQRLADNSVRVAAGSVTISGKGRFGESGFGFDEPLEIKMQPTDLTVIDEHGTAQTAHVPAVSLVLSGSGAVNEMNVTSIKNLAVTATVGTADAPLLATEISSDATVGQAVSAPRIELAKCDGDLAALQSAFAPLLPLVMPQMPAPAAAGTAAQPSILQLVAQNLLVCTSGKLSGSMLASYDGNTLTIQKPLTFSIANLTVQQRNSGSVATPINNETLALAIGGSVSPEGGQIHADVDTSYARKLSITNGQIVLARRQGDKLVPVGLFDKLQLLNVEVDDVDLVKLDALVNRLFNQAAEPAPGEKVIVVVPPPEVTSGTATLKIDISRAQNATTANISQAIVHKLAIKSGSNTTTWPNDITAKFSAELDTREDPTGQMPAMDQLVKA
jgi:hypothetical protein